MTWATDDLVITFMMVFNFLPLCHRNTQTHTPEKHHITPGISAHLKSSVVIATASIEAELREGFLCVACVSHSGRTASHSPGLQRRLIHSERWLLDF